MNVRKRDEWGEEKKNSVKWIANVSRGANATLLARKTQENTRGVLVKYKFSSRY